MRIGPYTKVLEFCVCVFVELQSKFTFSLNVHDTSVFDYSVEVETQSGQVQRKPDGLSWRMYPYHLPIKGLYNELLWEWNVTCVYACACVCVRVLECDPHTGQWEFSRTVLFHMSEGVRAAAGL